MPNVQFWYFKRVLIQRHVPLNSNIRQELSRRTSLLRFSEYLQFLSTLRNNLADVLTQFLGITNAPVCICLTLEDPVAQERRDISGLKGRNQPLVLKDCGLRERLTKLIGIHAYSLDVKFIILADLVSTTYRRNNC